MIDPFNVVSVGLAASNITWKLGIFWRDSATAPLEAQQLIRTIQLLKDSARNVQAALIARPNPSAIEERNHRSIVSLGQQCVEDLNRLQDILPEKHADAGRLRALKTHFELKLCEDSLRSIARRLQLCQNALTVEFQVLQIFNKEQSQTHNLLEIRSDWEDVVSQADSLVSHSHRWTDPELQVNIAELVDSIKGGAATSEERSEIASTIQDNDSGVALTEACTNNADNARRDSSAPSISVVLLPRVLPMTLENVERRLRDRKYDEAAEFQKSVIEYRQMFSGGNPIPIEVICRDDMRLADIYRRTRRPRVLTQAEWILVSTIARLDMEVCMAADLKSSLLAELYRDLGRISIDLNKPYDGSKHLTRAFDLIIDSPEPPAPLLKSVGTILYRTYNDIGQPVFAEALDEDVEFRCGFSLKTLAYCQKQGFDTESEDFGFDKLYKGTTPLHVAAKGGQEKILEDMLRHCSNVDVTEERENATPFLFACSQQDIVVINLLLRHGANPTAKDNMLRNGLHYCQRTTGGTGVARRLLETSPAVQIDAKDSYAHSALYLAASKGNLRMVQLLLTLGATPDILGPGNCTPLMGAVQATMRSQDVKMSVLRALLDHGADAGLKCARNETAADMANDGQVKKMLKKWVKEQGPKPTKMFSLLRRD